MATSVHKLVQTGLRGHIGSVCKIMFVQLAVRILWISPLFLPFSLPVQIIWLFLCGLFVLLPLRFRAACQLRSMIGHTDIAPAPYFRRVLSGALRLLLGGLWGLPLGGMLLLVWRYVFVLDASRYAQDAVRLGSFLAASAPETRQQTVGLLLVALVLLASLALFLYGWRRLILYEYLSMPSLAAARAAKKACRPALRKTLWVNLLTLLPALLLPLLFLVWRSGGVQNLLMSLFLLIGSGLVMDPASLWIALALFMCLHIPWIPYRKGRYAAAVNAYER